MKKIYLGFVFLLLAISLAACSKDIDQEIIEATVVSVDEDANIYVVREDKLIGSKLYDVTLVGTFKVANDDKVYVKFYFEHSDYMYGEIIGLV